MATLSTLGQMMLALPPQMPQYDPLEVARQQNLVQGGRLQNQTSLLALEDLRRQQETAAAQRQYYQQHPEALLGAPPPSTLGSLQGPGGSPPAAPGPLTQQTVAPGQPAGAPQVVPGGQDLSQFATGQPPPQRTLGTMGPPPAPPQNPLMDLARTNPDAALAVVDRQQKMQEQRLNMTAKVSGYLGSVLQGVNSQESYDAAKQDIARISPEWAQALPATYSKEALEPFVTRALSVKDAMMLQVSEVQARAELAKARLSGRVASTDNYLRALGVQPGQETPEQMQQALAMQQRDEVGRQAAQSENAARIAANVERTEKPLEGEAAKAVSDLTTLRQLTDDVGALRHNDYTGPVVGRTGYLREQAGTMSQQETAFRRTVKDMTDILARLRSGAALPPSELARLESLVPSVNDPPETFQAKLQSFQRAIEQQRASRLQTATTPRAQLREQMTPTTQQPGGQTSQAPLKPVSEMSTEELRAEKQRILGQR